MVDKLWAFLVALPDRAFRTAVLLILLAMGYAQWSMYKKIDDLASNEKTRARLAEITTELAVKEQRIKVLEEQVEKLWDRQRYWHGDTEPMVKKP